MNSPKIFKTEHRARFSELDPFGHMNTCHYVSYFLDHRFTGIRDNLGLDSTKLNQLDIIFVIARIEIKFLNSIFGDELFFISSHVSSMNTKSCKVLCEMKNSKEQIISICEFDLVCLNKENKKVVPWPLGFMEQFFMEG